MFQSRFAKLYKHWLFALCAIVVILLCHVNWTTVWQILARACIGVAIIVMPLPILVRVLVAMPTMMLGGYLIMQGTQAIDNIDLLKTSKRDKINLIKFLLCMPLGIVIAVIGVLLTA